MLQKQRSEENGGLGKEKEGEGRVNEESEGKSEGRGRWEASDCRRRVRERGRVLGVGRKVGSGR